jgi:hypothetical protein
MALEWHDQCLTHGHHNGVVTVYKWLGLNTIEPLRMRLLRMVFGTLLSVRKHSKLL